MPSPSPPPDGPALESIESPAKVMRIGSMVKQLLDEVRAAPLDERSPGADRRDLRGVGGGAGQRVVARPAGGAGRAAPSLADGEVPTEGEEPGRPGPLVGWLEGLFHGIQATLFAQQPAAPRPTMPSRNSLITFISWRRASLLGVTVPKYRTSSASSSDDVEFRN